MSEQSRWAKVSAVIASVLSVCITLPVWFYLWHYTLLRVNAGELQMFLFWVYVPLHLFLALLKVVVDVAERRG